MDALLMTCTQLKQGTTYNASSRAFECGSAKMQRLVTNVVSACGEAVYKHLKTGNTMIIYWAQNIMFTKYRDCLKAIDVTLQHGHQHRPTKPKQRI